MTGNLIGADLKVSHESRSDQPGEVLLIRVLSAEPILSLEGRAFGRLFPFFQDQGGWSGLVGVDLEAEPGVHDINLRIEAPGGTKIEPYTVEIAPKQFPERHLKVSPKFVNPPESELKRIRQESKRVRQIFSRKNPERLWSEPFMRPVAGSASSSFGKRSVFNGQPRSPHTGTDFEAQNGTPVRAPNRGHVVLADHLYYAGKTVIIDHGQGLYSYLAHLSEIDVEEGATIDRGQIVGKAGSTGRVTGPHLHWTLRLAETRVDPLSLLAVVGGETF